MPQSEIFQSLQGKTVWTLDAHGILYQVFHALPPMTSPNGEPVGAIYGFARDLLTLLFTHKPDILLCAFDLPGETFRHELDSQYKANRKEMPESLSFQIVKIRDLLEAFGIPVLGVPKFEADDVMATVAQRVEKAGGNCVLVTADKDCRQLITDHVCLFNLRKQQFYKAEQLLEDWGIRPDQVVDFQSIVGDASDNVPGIPLIGPKMATQLLQKYATLENVLDHAHEISGQKKKENLQNGRDVAMKSRELVRLRNDVPLEIDWETSVFRGVYAKKLRELFRDFGFRSLNDQVTRLEQTFGSLDAETDDNFSGQDNDDADLPLFSGGGLQVPEKQDHDVVMAYPKDVVCHLINTEALFEQLLEKLDKHIKSETTATISFDLETTSLEYVHAKIVGISFCFSETEAWYIVLRAPLGEDKISTETALQKLKPILENPNIGKIGQNLKYDMLILHKFGVFVAGVAFDTIIADYLLHPGEMSHSLDAMAERYLNHQTIKISELIGTGKKQKKMDEVPSQAVADYASEDAMVPWLLKPLLEKRLVEQNLMQLYRSVELPLIDVLVELEAKGIKIDVAQLKKLSQHYQHLLFALEKEIYQIAGEEFNIASPKQLQVILFDKLRLPVIKKTKTGPSTDVEVLEQLSSRHPLPGKIIEYRQAAKLKGTYIDALPLLADPETGRIHASFNQVVTATGRLSSSNPNLQNIPIRTAEGREIRAAFVPGAGFDSLLACDYSQVELRVLAHFTNDENLCRAFANNEDIHASVAAEVFYVPLDQVTKEMRRQAKAVNFGVIYGQSSFGLAKQLDVPQAQAAAFIDAYFAKYASIDHFFNRVLDDCLRDGYVTTLFGRKRYIRGIRSLRKGQFNMDERTAINTVIQGTAADLMKKAMLNIHQRLKTEKINAKMLLQIHDELVFEVKTESLPKLGEILEQEMPLNNPLRVPLVVDMKQGKNWGFE